MDFNTNIKLLFDKLKKRIKKNEGFSIKPYKDQLGKYTIGYGHLIKKEEKKYFNQRFQKKYFEKVFDLDFQKAQNEYLKFFFNTKHKINEKELLIEMIFLLVVSSNIATIVWKILI